MGSCCSRPEARYDAPTAEVTADPATTKAGAAPVAQAVEAKKQGESGAAEGAARQISTPAESGAPAAPAAPAAAPASTSASAAAPAASPAAPAAAPAPQPASEATTSAPAAAPAKPVPVSKLRTDCKVKDAYKLGKTLGTGGFAIVKLATDRRTNEQYAVKIMTLPPVGATVGDNENTREDIFKEIDILCGLNHENVVYLKEYFEENNKVYLITELVTGGELLEAVLARGSYSESEARACFVQLLRGIEYLHSKNVCHRDLKLENLLLATPDDITKVKIADFGLAKRSAGAMSTVCGTPQYVAPEVIQGTATVEYGPAVDMWSAGVVLFILLGGYPPFWHESEPALFEQIRKGIFAFDDPVWAAVSEQAKDLIRQLLGVDPRKRPTAAQCLASPWVTAGAVSSAPLTGAVNNMRMQMGVSYRSQRMQQGQAGGEAAPAAAGQQ